MSILAILATTLLWLVPGEMLEPKVPIRTAGAGSGRTDACADHHWDEGCTHGSGTAGCRRNGNVDEACDDGGGGD